MTPTLAIEDGFVPPLTPEEWRRRRLSRAQARYRRRHPDRVNKAKRARYRLNADAINAARREKRAQAHPRPVTEAPRTSHRQAGLPCHACGGQVVSFLDGRRCIQCSRELGAIAGVRSLMAQVAV